MKVSLGQFEVAADWRSNLDTCSALVVEASANGAELLLLPEGILARDIADPDIVRKTAQPLDGPFVDGLRRVSASKPMTVIGCVNVPDDHGRFHNTLFVLRDGAMIALYRKLHLYDAFNARESDRTTAGDAIPPLVEIGGYRVGLMTCYDVRFPELARRLACDGAEVLVLPAAWVRGLGKEAHWEVLTTARALENTCYLLAAGECGPRNIGASLVVDPLGIVIARTGEAPGLLYATIDRARIAHARKVLPVLENRRFGRPELRLP